MRGPMSLLSRLCQRLAHVVRQVPARTRSRRRAARRLRHAQGSLRRAGDAGRRGAPGGAAGARRRAAERRRARRPRRRADRNVPVRRPLRARGRCASRRPSPLAAIVSLALGIGANAAIFTFINALVLRPLPVRDPSALVDVSAERKNGDGLISFPMYRDIAERQQVLTGIVATAGETSIRVTVPSAAGVRPGDRQRADQFRLGQLLLRPRRRPGGRPRVFARRRPEPGQRGHGRIGRRAQRRFLGSPVRPRPGGRRPHHPRSAARARK